MTHSPSASYLRRLLAVASLAAITACQSNPRRFVYSSGFSFANYDFVVIGKPGQLDGNERTALYGLDVEFGSVLDRTNMKVIGEKEYTALNHDTQKRVLFVRLAMVATGKRIQMSVTFDDAVTGKAAASITDQVKGDIFNPECRTRAFEAVSNAVIDAIAKDKHLTIRVEDPPKDQPQRKPTPSSDPDG